MRLSQFPVLITDRQIAIGALAVTLIAGIGLAVNGWHDFSASFGDTDDAMRLVLVRDLVSGRGWYDQWIQRLQPPVGIYMHWSRLLDGALAGIVLVLRFFVSSGTAEAMMRVIWPFALIYPAVLCSLHLARHVGGSAAVFICAVLLASNQQAYAQFIPGRIDHHNVQIVMTLVASTYATSRSNNLHPHIFAGIASGLGLAIGLEAIVFHFLIGLSYAIRGILSPTEKRIASAYALALLLGTITFYGVQTPPGRWDMSFCDSIGLNLIAAMVTGSCGLLAVIWLADGLSLRTRFSMLAIALATSAVLYLLLDPACIGGPLASIDPRTRPYWFDQVIELKPWTVLLKQYFDMTLALILASILIIFAGTKLIAREWPAPQMQTVLICAITAAAIATSSQAFRMDSYVFWFGFPVLAAGWAIASRQYWRSLMLPTILACVLFSPVGFIAMSLAARASTTKIHPPAKFTRARCSDTADYRQLAQLSPGLVVADIDLGPYILVNTKDSVVSAPYHRANWGIIAAHDALAATPSSAAVLFRRLKISYMVECSVSNISDLPGGIESEVRAGRIPAWLQPLSGRKDELQIFRVRNPL
jgi:hypothetical protein